jgi:hypothetical protein
MITIHKSGECGHVTRHDFKSNRRAGSMRPKEKSNWTI